MTNQFFNKEKNDNELKEAIRKEVEQDFQNKIDSGEIKIVEPNPQRDFQNSVAELAANNRIIK